MESLVNTSHLEALYGSIQQHSFGAPPKFHIFVTHHKTPKFLDKCLQSLFIQDCSIPFHVHLVDDMSEMEEVTSLLDAWSQKEPKRLTVYRNSVRLNKGRNLFQLLDKGAFHPEDILGIVDGDDWLAHPQALQRIVEEYVTSGCWMTYGSYACSDGQTGNCTKPLQPIHYACEAAGRGFRETPWIFSHFFTAKAFLWKAVPRSILDFPEIPHNEGSTADQLFNIPIAEMASSKHIRHIADTLYVYNNQSALSDCVVRPKEQETLDQLNRKRDAFKPLERPPLDFLIVMPCRGRFPLLQTCLQRLKEEIQRTPQTVSIVLVEHSETPEYRDYARAQGVEWIFVPMSSSPMSPLGQFNRGLCFDIGFLHGPVANHIVCHDNDLLMPVNFFAKLTQNLQRGPYKALQTYSDRFVWQTNPEVSKHLIEDGAWFQNGFDVETHCARNPPGAKGGSITVSHEIYKAVGGHDPHLFFGYAAEDAFFWSKLEQLTQIGFAEQPRIPLVHLWHPPAASLNPFKHEMDILFHMFNSLPIQLKLDYIQKKSRAFQSKN
jgi:hypothetical protein